MRPDNVDLLLSGYSLALDFLYELNDILLVPQPFVFIELRRQRILDDLRSQNRVGIYLLKSLIWDRHLFETTRKVMNEKEGSESTG